MTPKRFRLTLVAPVFIGLVLAIAFAATFIITSRAADDIVTTSTAQAGSTTISVASRTLFDPLRRLDVSILNDELDNLVAEENITYAAVRDASGRIVAQRADGQSPEDETASEISDQALAQGSTQELHLGQHHLFSGPIAAGSEQIGTLDVLLDHHQGHALVGALGRTMLYYVLPLLAVAALVAVLFMRIATNPLDALAAAANSIRQGDLDTPVPASGMRETAALGAAMEHMRGELRDLCSRLEQRVEHRTRELSAANQSLRSAEERTRAIIDTASDAYIAMGADGRVTDWNAKAEEIFGWSRNEAIGLKLAETIIPPEHRKAHKKGLERFLDTGEGLVLNQRKEFTALCRDGGEIPVELTVWPIRSGDTWTFNAFIQDISGRKQVEQALEASEAKYRQIFENVQDIFFQTDLSGIILELSPAVERFGYTREDLIGTSVLDIYQDPDQRKTFVERILADGHVTDYELRLKTGDGQVVDASASAHIRHGEDGAPFGIEGALRDITERKRAEDALRESEAKYRQIFENVQDIFFQTDLSGIILELSPAVERFAYTREELIGTSVLDIYEDPEQRRTFVERLLTEGHVTDYELRLKTGDGQVVDASASAHIRHGEDGAPFGIEGALRDITERKLAEEALRESEGKFRTLAETIAAAAFISQGAKLRYVNPAAEAMTGYTRDELLTMNFWEVIHPDYRDVVKEQGLARERGEPIPVEDELAILTKDGEKRWVHFTGGSIEFEGHPASIGTAFDITARKELEGELQERATKDPLTSALNHGAIVEELRAVLSGDGDGGSHAVAVIDIDGLKPVNDTYGHQLGDQMLTTVADALSREGAIVGRYGGDEFVAVLRDADRETAERYSAAAADALAGAGLTDPESGAKVPVAASIGIAMYPEDAQTLADLIEMADNAMYAAKRQRPTGLAGGREILALGANRAAAMVGQIVPLLTSPGALEDKLRLVSHRIAVGAGYDAVNVDLFARPTGLASARNVFARVPDELIEAWRTEARPFEDDPITQLLLRTRSGIVVPDPQNDERLTEAQRGVLRAAQLRSAAVVPLFWEDQMIGSLSAASKRKGAFTALDIQFLTTVATQVTAIARMATLVDELQSSSNDLEKAHVESVMLLAASAEAHDLTTGRHLQGVRALTEALAKECGHDEDYVRQVGLAAVLHDIGKIRVPDAILSRSGQLTDEEWKLLKLHTTWGAEFLSGRPGFQLAATIAGSHHERWDGAGYPDGISQDAIPEAATIVAVADSFDAITHNRPYRQARSVAAALVEIRSGAGAQFNPKVVSALRRLYKRRALPSTREAEDHAA